MIEELVELKILAVLGAYEVGLAMQIVPADDDNDHPHKTYHKVQTKGKRFIMYIGAMTEFFGSFLRVQGTTTRVLTSSQTLIKCWEVGRLF